ncbi:tyrosine-type recombinase/integrase [Streptomyces rhizosphaericus]|uniref:tyrosine-type recombinase/integrase n=1 Tax=Streptomyces violaceusniger group TaxID=2839105 RepID=UPI00117DE970|nr:tyrosine-type recombinase/integrase [Streptomyces rhizosphaericus]
MTVAVFPAQRRQPDHRPEDTDLAGAWAEWLRGELNANWRPSEWNAEVLLFVGDPDSPHTAVSVCPVTGCGTVVTSPGYCKPCRDAYRDSGLAKEEYEATYTREFRRVAAHRPLASCAVSSCPRNAFSLGLCQVHYRGWAKAKKRPGADKAAWVARQQPLAAAEPCRVPGCSREKAQNNGLCRTHHRKWRLEANPADLAGDEAAAAERWAERQSPFLAAHMFSLAPLSPLARLEMLYVLQQRDARGQTLSPQAVRGAVDLLAELPSIALAGESLPDPAQAGNTGTVSFLRGLRWEIVTGFDRFRGVDPAQTLVWDLRSVSQQFPSLKKTESALRNPSSLDFGQIRQGWLRELVMHWARTTNPDSKELREHHWACVIASRALQLRSGGGEDPGKLQFSDVTAVVDAFRTARGRQGDVYSSTTQIKRAAQFFNLLDFGRREGILDGLSPRFVRHPNHHTIKKVDENDEEIGKALPDVVIRQLDENIHLLGQGIPYGDLPAEAVSAMLRTAYVVLRDTGRRPAEIAGLDLNCLEFDKGEYQLVWHNMKGRRRRRRLPVHQQTADAIKDWQEIRARWDLPVNSAGHLFPAITNRHRHLDTGNLARYIRAWADSIPVLDSEELGRDGTPLPFDRDKVFPYAFRHTFCQRYADAGVPLHVLQALMDHRSANTTAAYYQNPRELHQTGETPQVARSGQCSAMAPPSCNLAA